MATESTQPKKNRKPSSRSLKAAPGEIALYEELFETLVKYGPTMFTRNIWNLLANVPKGTGYTKADVLLNEFMFILWRRLNSINDEDMLFLTMEFDKSTRYDYAQVPYYARRVHLLGWFINDDIYYVSKRFNSG